jgi:hypothetical protein
VVGEQSSIFMAMDEQGSKFMALCLRFWLLQQNYSSGSYRNFNISYIRYTSAVGALKASAIQIDDK